MTQKLESKACSVCASAKRKCDRHTPACMRCRRTRRRCFYPPSRPSAFVRLDLDADESGSDLTSAPSTDATSDGYEQLPVPPADGLGFDLSALSHEVADSLGPRLWFTAPGTWDVYHFIPAERNAFTHEDLKRYASYIRGWLTDWIQTGSNRFIHSRLYRARFPQPMQRAFAALSSYHHRTPGTEASVLRILEDSAAELLREGEPLRGGAPAAAAHNHGDPLEALARVQALLIYQCIGLLDGNIRLQAQAEKRIPILTRWMERLVEQAKSVACLGSLVLSPDAARPFTGIALTDVSELQDLLWYSWMLAECIRRTWLVASGAQAIFSLLKDGQVDCMGGMAFTTRKDVFDAKYASSWERICSRTNVGMMSMEQAENLLQDASPDDLDEFANVVLEITFGTDRIERWKTEKG